MLWIQKRVRPSPCPEELTACSGMWRSQAPTKQWKQCSSQTGKTQSKGRDREVTGGWDQRDGCSPKEAGLEVDQYWDPSFFPPFLIKSLRGWDSLTLSEITLWWMCASGNVLHTAIKNGPYILCHKHALKGVTLTQWNNIALKWTCKLLLRNMLEQVSNFKASPLTSLDLQVNFHLVLRSFKIIDNCKDKGEGDTGERGGCWHTSLGSNILSDTHKVSYYGKVI